jgi:uncharacterized protein
MRKTALTIFAMLIAWTAQAFAAGDAPVSRTFEYKGYSKKEYDSYKQMSTYVEMSDGVKIAVDIYLPDKGPDRKKFPAAFELTPYSRAFINPSFKPLEKNNGKNMMGGRGAKIPNPFCFTSLLLERGYAVVIADVRGSGASFGSRIDLMPRLGLDGAELVEWIAKQDWSDGNVGMKGGSYMAITTILTASNRPPHLKAIVIMTYPFGYQDLYVGGVFSQGFMSSYSELLWSMNMNLNTTKGTFPVMPAAPVVDEDGDGEYLDEIPIDKNKDGDFTDDYKFPDDPNDPPQYEDGSPRKHIYYLATREHLKNAYIGDWVSKASFIDSDMLQAGVKSDQIGNVDGYAISPISRIPEIMKSGIPIYHIGGWMDAQPRSTTTFFATARKTNPSKLLMTAGYHILSSPYYKYFGEKQDAGLKAINTEYLRFFDRWLKGIQNGIDTEPPVTLFVMGKGWRQENEWPLTREADTDFYFAGGNSLSSQASAPGTDSFTADFTHDSSYGAIKGNRWLMYAVPDEVPDRASKDKQCLVYTSAPLGADVEVTGHPIVDFWVSSTAPDGDFFVYLEDVTPDGKSVLVTEMPQRAGFPYLRDINKMLLRGATGVDILPKLPWHGYEKADYVEGVFNGGKIVNLKFDLMPTSWVFKKGHAIRVSIAAADWPTFRLDTVLSPANKPGDPGNIIPKLTFYRDADHPSRITLPVIPE